MAERPRELEVYFDGHQQCHLSVCKQRRHPTCDGLVSPLHSVLRETVCLQTASKLQRPRNGGVRV